MPRPQFTLRALLVLLLSVACFFGGIRFERERQRREDLLAEEISREAERARAAAKAMKELQELRARLQEQLQRMQELQKGAQTSRRPGRTTSKLRVIPDVVWEDPGPPAR